MQNLNTNNPNNSFLSMQQKYDSYKKGILDNLPKNPSKLAIRNIINTHITRCNAWILSDESLTKDEKRKLQTLFDKGRNEITKNLMASYRA